MTDKLKPLVEIFEQLCRQDEKEKVFDVILDFVLFPYSFTHDFDKMTKCVGKLGHPHSGPLLWQYQNILKEINQQYPLQDHIGEFYEQYVSNRSIGQIFSPPEMADLAASLSIENPIPGEAYIDPTCGSGAMILAGARKFRGYYFYGSDISVQCCKMATYNMLVNDLLGEICHLEIIRNEFFGTYLVSRRLHKSGNFYPYYLYTNDADLSRVHLKTKEERQAIMEKILAQKAGLQQVGDCIMKILDLLTQP